MIDAPLPVGEEFADAVDVALTGALGIATQRPARHRAVSMQPQVIVEPKPLTEAELLAIAIGKLTALGRWELLTHVPVDEEVAFPMQACWTELMQRWAKGTLGQYERASIAQSVSWLASDLDQYSQQRREMTRLTDADLPRADRHTLSSQRSLCCKIRGAR